MPPISPRYFAAVQVHLGRHVVQQLLEADYPVRVASRHPERAAALFPDVHLGFESTQADIDDDSSVATAVAGVFGVVNAVSLYMESGQQTFHSVHVEGAARVARGLSEGTRLKAADLEKPQTKQFIAGVEQSVVHYGSSTGF